MRPSIDLRVPAPYSVDAGRIVMFGGRRIGTPDVAAPAGTRNDLDVDVEVAISELLPAATQTNREGVRYALTGR